MTLGCVRIAPRVNYMTHLPSNFRCSASGGRVKTCPPLAEQGHITKGVQGSVSAAQPDRAPEVRLIRNPVLARRLQQALERLASEEDNR